MGGLGWLSWVSCEGGGGPSPEGLPFVTHTLSTVKPRLRFWNAKKYIQQTWPGTGGLPLWGPMVAVKSLKGMLTRCHSAPVCRFTAGFASYRLMSFASAPRALQKMNTWYHCGLSSRAQ